MGADRLISKTVGVGGGWARELAYKRIYKNFNSTDLPRSTCDEEILILLIL
jgi:hypothetical protein